MATSRVQGRDVKVGDILWAIGNPHRITRIEPYVHPTIGEPWAIAYDDSDQRSGKPWGITLKLTNLGHTYEISAR